MLVYLARHAWAGHYGDPGWPDDSQRPLTAEGVERYRRVVAALAEQRGFAPQRIATSPYVRCVQTAELIAEAVGAPIDQVDDLAPGARLGPLAEWTTAAARDAVAWVGHNPDCERLLLTMIGEGQDPVRFAKGSVAAVRFDGEVGPGAGTLLWHLTAKRLGV